MSEPRTPSKSTATKPRKPRKAAAKKPAKKPEKPVDVAYTPDQYAAGLRNSAVRAARAEMARAHTLGQPDGPTRAAAILLTSVVRQERLTRPAARQ